jgi:MFS family permease
MLEQRHRRLLWLLAVACFSEGYDFALLTVALPDVRHAFHLSHATADLWVALLYLGALPALAWGRRADRHGRRGVLLVAIAGYVVAAAVTAAAPNIEFYVACQFVARCFIATQVAIAWTMAAEDLPPERRGLGFGVLALASALGTGSCSIVKAAVISPFDLSWRWLYVGALLFLVVVAFLSRALPESERYLAVERATTTPQPARLLVRPPYLRPLLVVCVIVLLVNLTTEATVFSIDFMQTRRHLSASTANLLLVAAGAATLPVLTFSGRVSDRIGRRRVCIAGLLVQSVGLVTFFVLARGTLALGLSLALMYIGLFAAWTTGAAFAVEMFPTSLRGAASSAAAMAKLLGQSASFAVSAALLTATHRPEVAILVLVAGLPAGALLIAKFIPETSRQHLADLAAPPADLPAQSAPLPGPVSP